VIGLDASYAPCISAKNNINIDDAIEKIVAYLPPPSGDEDAPLKALIFDSKYDPYKGVIVHICVREGRVKVGDDILMMNTGKNFTVTELGFFRPGEFAPCDELLAGDVGYLAASIKNVRDTAVGDTVTHIERKTDKPLPGYKKAQQMVFCGIYPTDGGKYPDLRDALEKLQMNDAALSFEPETSMALGFGFRCGFLGLLHYEIVQERLEREFLLDIISTAPSVIYKIETITGDKISLDNPTNMPDPSHIERMEEPIVKAAIMTPKEYVGNIMELCQERRGTYINMDYIDANRVNMHYLMPLNEIIYDFFDALKSKTRGYASLDYELNGYEESELVKLDIMLNGEVVDALSFIVHKDKAYARGRRMAEKLKDSIPRQNFEIPVQACVGGKIIARETIKAFRKDVLAKCYGGDITRKKKLLEKQKEGKKRMKQFGSVEVPQEAFMSVLKLDE
ncbi:elongation factor 4, partial [Candidatus Nomurabacteria bacterium]|nr:elongation factor 4 [Candidatus Nomurabacteria bacterium]